MKNSGFTMLEVVVVGIIVAVIAGLAIPRLAFLSEKTKAAEGLRIINALREAQLAYSYENGGAFADDIDDLDVTIPVSNNYDPISDANINTGGNIATATRRIGPGNIYLLRIQEDGTITCSGSNAAMTAICTKLGY